MSFWGVETAPRAIRLCDFGSAKPLVRGEPNVAYICPGPWCSKLVNNFETKDLQMENPGNETEDPKWIIHICICIYIYIYIYIFIDIYIEVHLFMCVAYRFMYKLLMYIHVYSL